MPELNGHNDTADTDDEPNEDAEELAEAYAALDEDRHQQADLAAGQHSPSAEPPNGKRQADAPTADPVRPGTGAASTT